MSKVRNMISYSLDAILRVVDTEIAHMNEVKDFKEVSRFTILKQDLIQAIENFKRVV